ncbi:hypothetical protein RB594_009883 [Gaeumannomyces avenae]
MSETPRITKGGFPQTPAASRSRQGGSPSPSAEPKPARRSLPLAPQTNPESTGSEPLIPLTILDAPTQRYYACGIYMLLWAWKLYDWLRVVDDNAESFWLFLKWIAIDLCMLFGLPELRIPWLELSQPVVIVLFFVHAVLDWMLMFNIPIPALTWLLGFAKAFFDKELSISDQYVKSSSILHNHSLIQGRQIINILPEGSALLNPEGTPFCIGGDRTTALIPIQFNATIPHEVELVRFDLSLDHVEEEVLKLSRSQLRAIEKQVKKLSPEGDGSAVTFEFPVKKTGAYKLRRVLDEYKLEVQRQSPHTFVVPCPSVSIGLSPSSDRCLNDLSDLALNVDGTPPLKIMYSRTINGKNHGFHFQSLQPDGFASPLTGTTSPSSSLLATGDEDVTWARSQRVTVSLNESLWATGEWRYSVDEVKDAFGNVVEYASPADDPELPPKGKTLVQSFSVKERPKVHLARCDIRNPLKVARGEKVQLPVVYEGQPQHEDDRPHTLTWEFAPIDSLTKNGDPGDVAIPGSHTGKRAGDLPVVVAPGLYTLKSVSAGTCEGEVREPSTCLLLNPLEPDLTIRSQEIPDTCAGNSVGLEVDLDLVGTPPFKVRYEVVTNGVRRRESVTIQGLRYQMRLIPRQAGTHKYTFLSIDDKLYKNQPLAGQGMTLEQSVKPAAQASMAGEATVNACLEDQVEIDVKLYNGDAPFTLEYEIVHDGRRTPYKVTQINSGKYTIKTPALSKGGEYTVALMGVQDKRGCRTSLQEEVKIAVRRQRPRAAFGAVEGRRKALNIETHDAKHKLPLRLAGVGPWTVTYKNRDLAGSTPATSTIQGNNGFLTVREPGMYELLEVTDSQCQGTVDPNASTFEVDWLPRPVLSLVEAESISPAGDKLVKKDVCEGDIDGFEINLKGAPPYHVKYEIRHKPATGSASMSPKGFDAALSKAAIAMDTSKPGLYTYTFSSLADSLYDLDEKQFTPVVLEQRVNAKPTATFDKPGQTFKFCLSEQEYEEKIPVTLTGVPPFFLELEIKHHSGTVPQVHHVTSIHTKSFGVQIPRELLRLGSQQVRIREVRDAQGCQSRMDPAGAGGSGSGSSAVNVQLYDAPAVYPLETRTDYCVGERIAYTLSGTPPFNVEYTFEGQRRAALSKTTSFRRVADSPGEFAITGVSDKASECRAAVDLVKRVHPMPSVRISRGRNVRVDIHEGGEVDILFEFGGTPPFEFTYTRSTNEKRGQRPQVLETRHDVSHEHSKVVRASQEGTYEVVAIKDRYCSFSTQQMGSPKDGAVKKLMQY